MFDLTLAEIAVRLIAAGVVLSLLGFCLAYFAVRLDDPGPAYDDRLTLNPLRHIGIFSILAVVGAQAGWVNPVDMSKPEARIGIFTPLASATLALLSISAIGVASLLLLPLVAAYWPAQSASFAASVLRSINRTAFGTAFLNLVPLPPLLGGHLVQALSPRTYAWLRERAAWTSALIFLCLVAFARWMGG